jgi:hypothetical protein
MRVISNFIENSRIIRKSGCTAHTGGKFSISFNDIHGDLSSDQQAVYQWSKPQHAVDKGLSKSTRAKSG